MTAMKGVPYRRVIGWKTHVVSGKERHDVTLACGHVLTDLDQIGIRRQCRACIGQGHLEPDAVTLRAIRDVMRAWAAPTNDHDSARHAATGPTDAQALCKIWALLGDDLGGEKTDPSPAQCKVAP